MRVSSWNAGVSNVESFDLIVIGSGPAGEKGAAQAAYFGERVALIERRAELGEGGVADVRFPTRPPRPAAQLNSATTHAKSIPGNGFRFEYWLLNGPMRGQVLVNTSLGGTQGAQLVCAAIIAGAGFTCGVCVRTLFGGAFVASAFRPTL